MKKSALKEVENELEKLDKIVNELEQEVKDEEDKLELTDKGLKKLKDIEKKIQIKNGSNMNHIDSKQLSQG